MVRKAAGSTGNIFQPSFLLACVLMATAACYVGPALYARTGTIVKEPLYPKKPLGEMSKADLGPYRFKGANVMSSAVEEALGAYDYIDWRYIDSSIKDARDARRHIRLLVTYNTGGRDIVAHVPDECWLGQGYKPLVQDNLELSVPALGRDVPVRAMTFVKSELLGSHKPTVIYLFHCNGDWVATRSAVRNRINSLRDEYAYYAKVEVTFGGGNVGEPFPGREESIEAARRFLDYMLPQLVEDHFPDWEEVNSESTAEKPDA